MAISTQGILLIIFAACSFGLIPLFAKFGYGGGLTPLSFSFFRSLFTTIILFAILRLRHRPIHISRQQSISLFKAGFFGYFLMMLTLFTSYNLMDTGIATTLHFIYPVATMAGAVIIFKEKPQMIQIGALAISLVGIFFLTGIDATMGSEAKTTHISIWGAILALISGFFYAYYILTVSHGHARSVGSMVQIFYISLFNSVTLLIAMGITKTPFWPISLSGWFGAIMVSLVSSVLGMVAFQAGLKMIGATTATILSTFEVVTSLIVGVILLDESLSVFQIIGSGLIICSVTAVALSGDPETTKSQ